MTKCYRVIEEKAPEAYVTEHTSGTTNINLTVLLQGQNGPLNAPSD